MLADLKYLWYVLKHKYYVFVAGRALGCDWIQLLTHDLSKFSKHEWTPYVNRFYRKQENKAEFYKALTHHWENNPHHWNFWIDPITDRPNNIPVYYIREMVADWMGAGKAKTGEWDILEWYTKERNRMKLHPVTRTIVESLIPGYGIQHYNNAALAYLN